MRKYKKEEMKYIKKLGVSKKSPSDDEKATFIKFLIKSIKNSDKTKNSLMN